jgi:acetyltransferase-like isoleucine patch superfamily enzyme
MSPAPNSTSMRKLRKLLKEPLHGKINILSFAWTRLKCLAYYRWIFAKFGNGSLIRRPLLLVNPHCIQIGSNVFIRDGVRLEALETLPGRKPQLILEDGVRLEQNVQIVCGCRVVLHRNVAVAPNSIIMDVSHLFMDIKNEIPSMARVSTADALVEIGEGTIVGSGVFILPNVTIGKGCFIGANSVVRRSIPDYCVVSGNPAAIVMHYNEATERWVKG